MRIGVGLTIPGVAVRQRLALAAGISAPVLTKTSAAGINPLAGTIALDSTAAIGMYWDVLLGANSAFTTPLSGESAIREEFRPIRAEDFPTDGTSTGTSMFTIFTALPPGLVYWKVRIGRDASDGTIMWGPFSNVISDTLSASYDVRFDPAKITTGVSLSADKRTMSGAAYGYPTTPAMNAGGDTLLTAAIGYMEFELLSLDTNGVAYVGVASSTYITSGGNYGALIFDRPNNNGYFDVPVGGGSTTLAAVGSKIGVLVHKATGKLWIRHPTAGWLGGTPAFNSDLTVATGAGGAALGITSFMPIAGTNGVGAGSIKINSGQDAFYYTLPTYVPNGWS